jgi:hypothetical protein
MRRLRSSRHVFTVGPSHLVRLQVSGIFLMPIQ